MWLADTSEADGVVALEPSDAIVLITDGFFEWPRSDGERFGLERLGAAMVRADQAEADFITAMRDAVEKFAAGEPQPDDLTAVVIRRTN